MVWSVFLDENEYRIHMPREFMDDLEGEVADEELHERTLGQDIFSADLYCEDALLLNIRQHRVFGVSSRQNK